MNIIIIGAGEIGQHLARSLSQEAHNTVVIEINDKLAADLDQQIDGKVIVGNGSSVNFLAEAGVAECDLFFALTSHDNRNLISCSMAKKLGAQKTICRVHPGLQREEWLFDYRGNFGIDHLFSSERLSSVELSKFIRNPSSLLVEEIARGRIEIQQVYLSKESPANGITLEELKLPDRIRISTITRNDDHLVPTATETLRSGDIITIFGEPKKLRDVVDRLQKSFSDDDPMRVVIFGGDEYGFSLAQMLDGWNCKVRIFEKDSILCEELSNRLSNTTILNADATSLSELREEQVGEADFFVATSRSDEDNVMTCLQAKSLGTKNCLTLIHRADYADVISSSGSDFGISAAVSPREATRRELMRFITSDKYHVVQKVAGGELIEAIVSPKSAFADNKLSQIEMPSGCVLVALIHGIHASVPAANDVIKAGDNIYAMVSESAKKPFLKLLSKK